MTTTEEDRGLTGSTCDELFRAKVLLERGEYRASLNLVEAAATRGGLTIDDSLAWRLLEGRLRGKLGELRRALALVDEAVQTARGSDDHLVVVQALTIRAEVSWRSGEFKEGLQSVEEGEELLARLELKHEGNLDDRINWTKGELLHQKGILLWYSGDLDGASECHQRSLKIKEELGNQQGMADSLNNLGLVLVSKGNLDKATEYYERSLSISEELGNKWNIATSLNNIGIVFTSKGDLDKALEYYERSLSIREGLGRRQDIAQSLVNIGVVYEKRGDLDQAVEHYQGSLAINEALGAKQGIALGVNNLGGIYLLRGDLDQALEYYQRSLIIYRELGIKQAVAMALANVGETYRKKGNLKKALKSYQQSLAIYKETGNDPLVAIVLFDLMVIALEQEEHALAQQHLQELEQITERADNRIIDQRYRVARALSLKASKRTRSKMKAAEILEQVVGEEVGDHSLTVIAMIHLCDLLLFELKMTRDEDLFKEIKDLTSQLLEIAEKQASPSLRAETYLLQSKLALIELDLGRARKLLRVAHSIAQEKGLKALTRTVGQERDLLQSKLHQWANIIEQQPSKQEMIDLTKLEKLLERMIRKAEVNLRERSDRQTTKGKDLGILEWLKGSE